MATTNNRPTGEDAYNQFRDLLITALKRAEANDGNLTTESGVVYPRRGYNKPNDTGSNILMMGLHASQQGYKTGIYLSYGEIEAQGLRLAKKDSPALLHFFRVWDKYEHRLRPDQLISAEEYKQLPEAERRQYKGKNDNVSAQKLYNIDQTNIARRNQEAYESLLNIFAGPIDTTTNDFHHKVNEFQKNVSNGGVKIATSPDSDIRYSSNRDRLFVPTQSRFNGTYEDWHAGLVRGIVGVLGTSDRLGRLDNWNEQLIVHLASAEIMMSQFGRPYKIPKELSNYSGWISELQNNPRLIKVIESEVNRIHEAVATMQAGKKYVRNAERAQMVTEAISLGKDPDSDRLLLKSISAYTTLPIPSRAFNSPEEESAFWSKYPLIKDYNTRAIDIINAFEIEEDPDVRTLLESNLEEIQNKYNAHISALAVPPVKDWTHCISDRITDVGNGLVSPNTFVVVYDRASHDVSVVVNSGAYPNGAQPTVASRDQIIQALTSGKSQIRTITPRPALTQEEKNGMTAQEIAKRESPSVVLSPMHQIANIRFFNKTGEISFDPSDLHFVGKEVYGCTFNQENQRITLEKFDWETELSDKIAPVFERTPWAIMNDSENRKRAAFLFVPVGDAPEYFVYMDRQDQNAYFDAQTKLDSETFAKLRNAYATRYFLRAQADPSLITTFAPSLPPGAPTASMLIEQGPAVYLDREHRPYMYIKFRGLQADTKFIKQGNYEIIMHSRDDVAETYKMQIATMLFKDRLELAMEKNKDWLEEQTELQNRGTEPTPESETNEEENEVNISSRHR